MVDTMLEIGSLIEGKYKILNKIGQGGMSVVYLAMNEKANKQWAIKEVRKDGMKDFEVVKQGLVVETDMLKKLSHPNLPSIVDIIDEEDTFLIVMDYIQGNPLSKSLEEFGAQPQDNVINWAKQLCDVLGYLHTRTPAIIYRDMKPANIMLKPNGDVTLIDFGTAREFKEKNIADTTCLGTIGYAAPEQFGGMGQTDARTDIYCLGATLYHLVTGCSPCEPPYEIKPITQINPTLSSGLEKIILKCTQRNPEDRYQSAAELKYDLEHISEIDDVYIKKQKRVLKLFLTTFILTVTFAAASVWGYVSAESLKKANYDYILKNAVDYEDYYEAILTDPTVSDAYIKLSEFLLEDGELSTEDASVINKIRLGIDQRDKNGKSIGTVNVLEELKSENENGYIEVCDSFGNSFFNYTKNDKYRNSAEWFEDTKDAKPINQIYCDIADCLKGIDKYQNSKVSQSGKEYDEYEKLWKKLLSLKEKTDSIDSQHTVDVKINAGIVIADVINDNAVKFLEVASDTEIKDLLNEVESSIESINRSNIENRVNSLVSKIATAKAKIDSVKR